MKNTNERIAALEARDNIPGNSDSTEVAEEVSLVETRLSSTMVTRSAANKVQVKRENIPDGDIRCPDRGCNRIVSFEKGNRGCNVVACTSHNPYSSTSVPIARRYAGIAIRLVPAQSARQMKIWPKLSICATCVRETIL